MLIYSAKRYDLKGKRLLQTNEKYFVNDQGLRAIKFDNIKDVDKILENITFFSNCEVVYKIMSGENLNSKFINLLKEIYIDMYIVDEEFNWTYSKIHEEEDSRFGAFL